jgi:hypothetical protein
MIDLDKASMAGLVRPAPSDCARCHDNDEPNHARDFEIPAGAEWEDWVHRRDESRD